MTAHTYDLAAAYTRRAVRDGVFGPPGDRDYDQRDAFYERERARIAKLSPAEIDAEIAAAATDAGGASVAAIAGEPAVSEEPESPEDLDALDEPETCSDCDGTGEGRGECGRCEYCVGNGRGGRCSEDYCECEAGQALADDAGDPDDARIHDREDR